MYSLISVDNEKVTKAEGVNKKIRQNMKRIQGKLQKIGTYDVCKISLSFFDDKRYIIDDGVKSLAYFHKDIEN